MKDETNYERGYRDGKRDVMEKIRAEIEQITDTMGVSYNQYVSKIDVLKIIDQHKAERRRNEPNDNRGSGGNV